MKKLLQNLIVCLLFAACSPNSALELPTTERQLTNTLEPATTLPEETETAIIDEPLTQTWEGDISVVENLTSVNFEKFEAEEGKITFYFFLEGEMFRYAIESKGVMDLRTDFTEDDGFRVIGKEADGESVIYNFEYGIFLPMAKDLTELKSTAEEVNRRIEAKREADGKPLEIDWSAIKGRQVTGLLSGADWPEFISKQENMNLLIADFLIVHLEGGGHIDVLELGYKKGNDNKTFFAVLEATFNGSRTMPYLYSSPMATPISVESFKERFPVGTYLNMDIIYGIYIRPDVENQSHDSLIARRDLLAGQGVGGESGKEFTNIVVGGNITPPDDVLLLADAFYSPQ